MIKRPRRKQSAPQKLASGFQRKNLVLSDEAGIAFSSPDEARLDKPLLDDGRATAVWREGETLSPPPSGKHAKDDDEETLMASSTMLTPDDLPLAVSFSFDDITQVRDGGERANWSGEGSAEMPTRRALAPGAPASSEVYRRFLQGEYAPALRLAQQLIARGCNHPILPTIAEECRVALGKPNAPASADESRAMPPPAEVALEPYMTLAEVADLTGLSTAMIIGLLQRFVLTPPLAPPRANT